MVRSLRNVCRILFVATIVAAALSSSPQSLAAPAQVHPYIGYVYPAGGQQGSVFSVLIGGQSLRGVTGALISGEGIRAAVESYTPAAGPLDAKQKDELRLRIKDIVEAKKAGKQPAPRSSKVDLPDLPELRNLEELDAKQLKALADKYISNVKRAKPPMAEEVVVRLSVDRSAILGNRELRLITPTGLSNPLVFQISDFHEVAETQSLSDENSTAVEPQPLRVPTIVNGQIMPGDVDRYKLQLAKGQEISVVAYARELIPYIADAVPGWFQAVIALYDAEGREVAYSDDCGYDPDPILKYRSPSSGLYTLEIRDSIYRGRYDFVYRLAISDSAALTSLLAGGTRGGVGFTKQIGESRLPETFKQLSRIDEEGTKGGAASTSQTMSATRSTLVYGLLSRPGEKDSFSFSGREGDEVVIEVFSRRAGSPLDSLVEVIDGTGGTIAFNDDCEDKGEGLKTHHADSYLTCKLPSNGVYSVRLTDVQNKGGDEFHYWMRVGPRLRDYRLITSPSSINVTAGRVASITLDILRTDRWDGEIDIRLKESPPGCSLTGGHIASGQTRSSMTLTIPKKTAAGPSVVVLEGIASINGKYVTRQVMAADMQMQAFAYYHPVPTEHLYLYIGKAVRNAPDIRILSTGRVRIPAGGQAEVMCEVSPVPKTPLSLEIVEAPTGITIAGYTKVTNGYMVTLAADATCAVDFVGNVIVRAVSRVDAPAATSNSKAKTPQQTVLGILPAIEVRVISK